MSPDAVITHGFDLCPYIIHAVGPVYRDGKHHKPQLLYGCYKAALNLCKENNIHSVGFPLITAGIFGYSIADAWRKAIQACQDFIGDNPDYDIDIRFAVPSHTNYQLGLNTLNGIVNNHSVKNKPAKKFINKEQLQEAIDSLLQMKPFPLLDLIDGIDAQDGHTYEWYVRHAGNVNVSKLSISDCINYIDFLFSQERFCDGFVDGRMRDGTFLRILFRIQDLMM